MVLEHKSPSALARGAVREKSLEQAMRFAYKPPDMLKNSAATASVRRRASESSSEGEDSGHRSESPSSPRSRASRIAQKRLERCGKRAEATPKTAQRPDKAQHKAPPVEGDPVSRLKNESALHEAGASLEAAGHLRDENTHLKRQLASAEARASALAFELRNLRIQNDLLSRTPPIMTSTTAEDHITCQEGVAPRLDYREDSALQSELLLAAGWDMRKRTYVRPDAEVVELLLNGNPQLNRNCRSNQGMTPLGYASWHGDEHTILVLLEGGADVNAENIDKTTPLHMTIFNHQVWAAALLMANGAGCDESHREKSPIPSSSQ